MNIFFKLNLQLFADPSGEEGGTPSGTDVATPTPQATTENNNVSTSATEQNTGVGNQTPTNISKLFTQSQVNDLIRARLTRQYNRYGVKDRNEMDSLINKARSYDVMKEKFDNMSAEQQTLNEKIAFMGNNINPDRYDDVRAFFKGSNTIFNEGNLIEALKTHPEWVKNQVASNNGTQTTIQVLGTPSTPKPGIDEKAIASKIFGVNL